MITDVTNIASQLLTYDPAQCWPVSKFTMSILPEAKPTINCFQALDYLYATIRVFLRLFDSHAVTGSPIAARQVAHTFCSLVILPVLPAVQLE